MPKRLLASIVGFLVLTALGLWPASGAAQTVGASIAINHTSQSTFLADANGKQFSHAYTPSTTQLLWVNKKECQQNLTYQVSVTATGIQGLPIEVWASQPGTDCSSQLNRYNTPICWRVFKDIAQNGTYTIPIRVEDIVAQKPIPDPTAPKYIATASDCNIAALTVPSGGISIALYFYVFSGLANGTPTYSDSWDQFGFDLVGPNPPATVTVGLADSELHLHWTSVLDPDRAGFHIYCAPGGAVIDVDSGLNSGGAASTGGGATATGGIATTAGGTGGSSSTAVPQADAGVENPQCPNTAIAAGKQPPDNISPSGTASTITATDAYATGLNNGTNYACAISVIDVMGNDGPLSQNVCGNPQPVNDLFTAYRKAGGKGGGGFCSIGRPGSAIGQMIPLACLALLALRRRGLGRSKSADEPR